MQCSSFKMALCHDRMYIIGPLACADHFTTGGTQSQTHTSRSPSFNVDSGSVVFVWICEREVHIVTQQDQQNQREKQDTLLNLF